MRRALPAAGRRLLSLSLSRAFAARPTKRRPANGPPYRVAPATLHMASLSTTALRPSVRRLKQRANVSVPAPCQGTVVLPPCSAVQCLPSPSPLPAFPRRRWRPRPATFLAHPSSLRHRRETRRDDEMIAAPGLISCLPAPGHVRSQCHNSPAPPLARFSAQSARLCCSQKVDAASSSLRWRVRRATTGVPEWTSPKNTAFSANAPNLRAPS